VKQLKRKLPILPRYRRIEDGACDFTPKICFSLPKICEHWYFVELNAPSAQFVGDIESHVARLPTQR
jgi:hypothetical protein